MAKCFNFDNMPIYGPIEYGGNPIAFRMSVFDLDVMSGQAKALLKSVSTAGAVAFPPSAPVLDLLNSFGQTLASGAQNDLAFRYTAVFDPNYGVTELNHFVLEAGNYVVIRSENRKADILWDDLELNENEGMVYEKCKEEEDCERRPYTQNTWLLFEINKVRSSEDLDLSQNTFAELLESLREEDKKKSVDLETSQKAILNVTLSRVQTRNFNKAKSLLDDIKRSDKDVERAAPARELLSLIHDSLEEGGNLKKFDSNELDKFPRLTDRQIDFLLSELRNEISNPVPKDFLENGVLTRESLGKGDGVKKLPSSHNRSPDNSRNRGWRRAHEANG